MDAVVRSDLKAGQFAAAREAAVWVRAFHPDIAVTLDRTGAQLASDARSAGELRLIWQCALANETLLARGAAWRAATLEALLA